MPKRMEAPYRLEDEYLYRQVNNTFVHESRPIILLDYTDPGAQRFETIRVTANHPVWIKRKGWVAADNARVGSVLTMANFANVMVMKVRPSDEVVQVYNIGVDEFRTYYVGNEGIWVHD